MADKLPWKVAWITGASGAICGEVAKRLAHAGVTVAATARPSGRLGQEAPPCPLPALPQSAAPYESFARASNTFW